MTDKPSKPVQRSAGARRLLPVIRVLLIPLICVLALFAGLAIGYVTLGGQPFADVWKLSTWKHLFDLVFAP
ncbi:DNA-directed RNA polymerase subunit beta [Paenibacillus aurantius]|uniref:DNA-directed RNA polymerase subunit beta n=1 Tax=Paenibacillus aurantius TaxID=2918900 RepID=A0AA96RF44_9BACL|nr:DNA-directed RNA polymerase subunit beta [Paenibacillus aurantius]WNQ11577.1 DNA-directed RNA polymerase subunit beta [Paenibacillus aurantius]